MRTISIAPTLEEIRYEDGKVITEFNGLRIVFTLKVNLRDNDIDAVKRWLQQAIAMSSKTHQIKALMSELKTVDGEPVGELSIEDIGQ